MKDTTNHPARSADFLSRLHDGELEAGERARFESHRAHCAECRRAAAEFEGALSLFRSSRTSPPPPDLSARILRRLQAASPVRSRQRFGIVHGINLKWAAGFAVAVIAAVLGFSIVMEREATRRAILRETPPIPVRLDKAGKPAEPPARPAETKPEARSQAGLKPESGAAATGFAPDAGAGEHRNSLADRPAPGGAPAEKKKSLAASREAREASEETRESGLLLQKDAATTGFARNVERPGGEGAAAPSAASAEPGAPARLLILPLDGEGNPPEVVNADAGEMLSGLRGRRYQLLVEAGGRVREVRAEGQAPSAARTKARASLELEKAAASSPVWNLRFKPGDRPRRLLLRVE